MATSDQALARRETTALSEWAGEEWEADGTENTAPLFPVIKLVQTTSAMEGATKHMGEFFNPDTGEFLPSLNIVPLFQKQTRAIFEDGHDQPRCVSDDGYAPRADQPLWRDPSLTVNKVEIPVPAGGQPGRCEDCVFSRWGKDGEPPFCRESTVILADMDGDLVQVRVSGKSIKPWRTFVAQRISAKKRPLCSYRVHLTSTPKSDGPQKRWFELLVESDDLTKDEALRFNAVIRYERERFAQAIQESHEPEADEAGPGPEWGDGAEPIRRTPTPTPRPGFRERVGEPSETSWATTTAREEPLELVPDDSWAFVEEPTT